MQENILAWACFTNKNVIEFIKMLGFWVVWILLKVFHVFKKKCSISVPQFKWNTRSFQNKLSKFHLFKSLILISSVE